MFKSIYRIYEGARLLFRMYRVYLRAKNIRYIQLMRRSGTPVKPKKKLRFKDSIFYTALQSVYESIEKVFFLPKKKTPKVQYIGEEKSIDITGYSIPSGFGDYQTMTPDIVEKQINPEIPARNAFEYAKIRENYFKNKFIRKSHEMEKEGYKCFVKHDSISGVMTILVSMMGIKHQANASDYESATKELEVLKGSLQRVLSLSSVIEYSATITSPSVINALNEQNLNKIQSQVVSENSGPILFHGSKPSQEEIKIRDHMQKKMESIYRKEALLKQDFLLSIANHSSSIIQDSINKKST